MDTRLHLKKRWRYMLDRCACKEGSRNYEWYKDVTVCDDWHCFENFYAWAVDLQFIDKQLDKDLLGDGTLYSPETCVFINATTNCFLRKFKDEHNRGITNVNGRYMAKLSNPFSGINENLGTYETHSDARTAYNLRKHYIAELLADTEEDPRAKVGLSKRFMIDESDVPMHVILEVGRLVEKNNY